MGGVLDESERVHRRVHRVVLHRIDFTHQERHFGRVAHRRRRTHRRIRNPRDARGRRRGHHQNPVQAHRPLDRGVRARLDQVGAGLQRRRRPRTRGPAHAPAQLRAGARLHFGRKGLDAIGLRRRIEVRARVGQRPGHALRCMRRTRHLDAAHAARRAGDAAQATAHLTHDGERGRHPVAQHGAGLSGRCEDQIVGQRDRQVLTRRDGDHHRRPMRPGIRVRGRAGRGRAGHRRAATVAPHRHRRAVRQRRRRRGRRQIDRLLGQGRAGQGAGAQERERRAGQRVSRAARAGRAAAGETAQHRAQCPRRAQQGLEYVGSHRRSPEIPYFVSSITNSRESTSIIMNMPPGNTLLVVISRSLCECHM